MSRCAWRPPLPYLDPPNLVPCLSPRRLNRQSLYIAEVDSTTVAGTRTAGKMTKTWLFQGTALQVGQIGHGGQTNDINSHRGMKAMLDNAHIAVTGGFKGAVRGSNL